MSLYIATVTWKVWFWLMNWIFSGHKKNVSCLSFSAFNWCLASAKHVFFLNHDNKWMKRLWNSVVLQWLWYWRSCSEIRIHLLVLRQYIHLPEWSFCWCDLFPPFSVVPLFCSRKLIDWCIGIFNKYNSQV